MARLLAVLLFLLPLGAFAGALERVDLHASKIEGCKGLPLPSTDRSLRISGSRAVDVDARYWVLDRPAAFENGVAVTRYRVGEGLLRIESRLASDFTQEVVSIRVERTIEPSYLAIYLAGVTLPCERQTRYSVKRGKDTDGDIEQLAEFDRNLHQAEELGYDRLFSEAEALLRRAIELRPDDSAAHWMMSRLSYLHLEARASELPSSQRVQGYEEAEVWADQAVARAPLKAEGYLWQGVARGRIATSLGNIRIALQGAFGGRGPKWLEQTLARAASLQDDYRFFGFSTRADALYALAQFYRLAPDAWYMSVVGTRGDLDRSIELLEQAVEIQPVRIEYRKELAVGLLCRGSSDDIAAARSQLEAILRLPAISAIDGIDHAHARAMLGESPQNICWYSRDGFQKADS
ncbi:MAG: hypothetical protein GY725_17715 [bacterium]|nr:hypothetical protein [bacterium]